MPMDNLTETIAHILGLAEKYFDYPLEVFVEAKDGQLVKYVFSAKGQAPAIRESLDDDGSPFPQFPVTVDVYEQAAFTAGQYKPAIQIKIAQPQKGGRRATEDLIALLDAKAKKHSLVAIAVGFADANAITVRADDPGRENILDDAIGLGGVPLGLITVDHQNKETIMRTRVFLEQEEEVAGEILRELAVKLGEVIRR